MRLLAPASQSKTATASFGNAFFQEVQQQMTFGACGDDIATAVEHALANQGMVSPDVNDSEQDRAIQRGITAVQSWLPDTFEYELISTPESGLGLHIKSGCPHCGNEALFNARLSHSHAQFVAMTAPTEAVIEGEWYDATDGDIICTVDDADISATYIACGACDATLVDTDSVGDENQ